MSNVAELRKAGWKVRVSHYRFYLTDWGLELLHRSQLSEFDDIPPEPRGGETVVELLSPQGMEAIGVARCNQSDNYNRRYGVMKALGRAISNLNKVGDCS